MRRLALVLALAVALVVISGEGPRPAELESRVLQLVGAPYEDQAAIFGPIQRLERSMVGFTWASGDPGQVRYRLDGGPWEVWNLEADHSPDGGETTMGTVALYTAESNVIEITTERPVQDPSLFIVEGIDESRAIPFGSAALGGVGAPPIVPREAWGGVGCENYAEEEPSWTNRVQVAVVHHTTGSNSYGPEESAGLVAAICEYHTKSNGWIDIGYNFLIDRYGVIFEGRRSAENGDLAVGAHVQGINSQTVGIALIGDFRYGPPTAAAQQALGTLLTWLSEQEHIDPNATSRLVSADGTVHVLKGVAGHSDISETSCPGAYCYALLPNFRQAVEAAAGPRIFIDDLTPDHPDIGDELAATFSFTEPMTWTFRAVDQEGTELSILAGSGTTTTQAMAIGLGMEEVFFELEAVTASGYAPPPVRMSWHKAYLGRFSDDDDSPNVDSIERIAAAGITLGCDPDAPLFCPDGLVTRGQMATFLARALALPPTDVDYFTDDDGSGLEPSINAFAASGITLGCADGLFCPRQVVPREQMAAFLTRALSLPPNGTNGFDDVSGFFAPEINAMAAAGIIIGCNPEGTLFCPKQLVTRQDMAGFLDKGFLGPQP